jgi:DNA-binding NtrC family response regulator
MLRGHLFFLLLILICSVDLRAQEPVHIAITETDIEVLGGWPLDRKWYAIAVQNLTSEGVRRVYIDISFPAGDLSHPESDEYFFQQLQSHENILLLASENAIGNDSVKVLGRYLLPAGRFFAPFSSMFDIQHDMLHFENREPRCLAGMLLARDANPPQALVEFPSESPGQDYHFVQAVQGQVECSGSDVVIGLDYAGATSYVVNKETQNLISTTQLQLHAAGKLRLNEYYRKWSPWAIGAGFSLALLPLVGARFTKRKMKWGLVSFCLCLASAATFMFLQVYVELAWYLALLVPVGFVGYCLMDRSSKSAHPSPSFAPKEVEVASLGAGNRQELDDLRYKLKFYEHLESQVEPEDLTMPENAGIIHHQDSPLRQILPKARKIAESDVPVMLFGESGTGKEMLARFIHECSGRADQPFVAVNCASLNDNLIESELFGHEAGAFTGARTRRAGRFELADGGTLFLDEIGEISPAVQVKLLRVLQAGSFERVGGTESVQVSVRMLAATHQDLPAAIAEKGFREDLYFRLNGFSLHLPALRDRPVDIEELFKVFLFESGPNLKTSPSLVNWLKIQKWNGNVRELKSATERAVINAQLYQRQFLIPLDFEIDEPVEARKGASEQMSQRVLESLRRHQFRHRSISETANELAIHRVTVTEYLRGWVIRLMIEHDSDPDVIAQSLYGRPTFQNQDQLVARVEKYVDGIKGRIREGLREGEAVGEIRLRRFKNIPKDFEEELRRLIQRLQKKEL